MRTIAIAARRGTLALSVLVAVAATTALTGWPRTVALLGTAAPARTELPDRLTDAEFWALVGGLSEPGGYFRSDNLVSNEVTFQHVIPELQRTLGAGGVYLGVGPDQNFTYIAALQPRIAFIIDIRRGNLLQHLLYKALMEGAEDRAEFLSLLFSRPRPAAATTDASAASLVDAFSRVSADSVQLEATLRAVERRLVRAHGFPLGEDDMAGIAYVLRAFHDAGPDLTYSFGRGLGGYGGYGLRGMPTFGALMPETDADGVAHGYLASEAQFRRVQSMQLHNLVVPVVGDFAGPRAVRAVGDWLRRHSATVSAIYTSNVEQYLFQGDEAWRRYYDNVGTLPLDSASVFVRAVFNYLNYRDGGMPRGPRSVTMLAPVQEQLRAVRAGEVHSYWDVVQLSRAPVAPARW